MSFGKARANLQKHGVSFEEAATALSDPLSFTTKKGNRKYMKRTNQLQNDEFRDEYLPTDFKTSFIKGKYVDRIRKSSNIVVLKPEVAKIFPNEEAVNNALLSLIEDGKQVTKIEK